MGGWFSIRLALVAAMRALDPVYYFLISVSLVVGLVRSLLKVRREPCSSASVGACDIWLGVAGALFCVALPRSLSSGRLFFDAASSRSLRPIL